LNDAEEPVAFGEKGTLWVGGAGVSKGYINLPKVTADKFRPDKFANDGSVIFSIYVDCADNA
jgi:non-ribosomal peptide synthetase component F